MSRFTERRLDENYYLDNDPDEGGYDPLEDERAKKLEKEFSDWTKERDDIHKTEVTVNNKDNTKLSELRFIACLTVAILLGSVLCYGITTLLERLAKLAGG